MRGDIVYRVYGVHAGRAEDTDLGTYRTRAEAEAEIATLSTRETRGENWARRYHDRGFVVREIVVETEFEVPPRPEPRDRYVVRAGCRSRTRRDVGQHGRRGAPARRRRRRARAGGDLRADGTGRSTRSEPFRQGDREFALIAPRYTGTSRTSRPAGSSPRSRTRSGGSVRSGSTSRTGGTCTTVPIIPWLETLGARPRVGLRRLRVRLGLCVGRRRLVEGPVPRPDRRPIGRDPSRRAVRLRRARDEGIPESLFLAGDGAACGSSRRRSCASSATGGPRRSGSRSRARFDLASGRPKEWQRLRVENLERPWASPFPASGTTPTRSPPAPSRRARSRAHVTRRVPDAPRSPRSPADHDEPVQPDRRSGAPDGPLRRVAVDDAEVVRLVWIGTARTARPLSWSCTSGRSGPKVDPDGRFPRREHAGLRLLLERIASVDLAGSNHQNVLFSSTVAATVGGTEGVRVTLDRVSAWAGSIVCRRVVVADVRPVAM